jgi:hypothetical protein
MLAVLSNHHWSRTAIFFARRSTLAKSSQNLVNSSPLGLVNSFLQSTVGVENMSKPSACQRTWRKRKTIVYRQLDRRP